MISKKIIGISIGISVIVHIILIYGILFDFQNKVNNVSIINAITQQNYRNNDNRIIKSDSSQVNKTFEMIQNGMPAKIRFKSIAMPYASIDKINQLWQSDSLGIIKKMDDNIIKDGREILLYAQQQLNIMKIGELLDTLVENYIENTEVDYRGKVDDLYRSDILFAEIDESKANQIRSMSRIFPKQEILSSMSYELKTKFIDKINVKLKNKGRDYNYYKNMWKKLEGLDLNPSVKQLTEHVTRSRTIDGYNARFCNWIDTLKINDQFDNHNIPIWNKNDDNILSYLKKAKNYDEYVRMYGVNRVDKEKIQKRKVPENKSINMARGYRYKIDKITPRLWPKEIYNPTKLTNYRNTLGESLEKPNFYTNVWGGAVRVEAPILLDGFLNEWIINKRYGLYGKSTQRSDLPGSVLLLQWDNTGLYFAYRISDVRDNPFNSKHIYNNDVICLFVDPHNIKKRRVYLNCNDGMYNYYILPRRKNGAGLICDVHKEPDLWKLKSFKYDGIKYASIRRGNSYTCEGFVPKYLLKDWEPSAGNFIGFGYLICNGEIEEKDKLVEYRWFGDSPFHHLNGYTWGDVFLMGTNADVKIDDMDFVPGKILDIVVNDLDMNRDSHKKEVLTVTIKTDYLKENRVIELDETHINSGVFKVRVPTKYSFGISDRYLSTRPGDKISVRYFDRYRKGDYIGRSLQKEIFVGRAIYRLSDM